MKSEPSPAPARSSASLVLLSPLGSNNTSSDGFDYKVCLLKRGSTMSVAASATVFPGGNLDAGDTSLARRLLSSAGSSSTSSRKDADREEDMRMTALRVCALRETFEETGYLVRNSKSGKNSLDSAQLEDYRRRVYKDPNLFLEVYKASGQDAFPDLDSLTFWSRWITPVQVVKRFDTAFFLHILPEMDASSGQSSGPILIADAGETSSAEWITPRQAVDACVKRKDLFMMPPQIYLLSELARLPTIKAVRQHAQNRQLITFLPRLRSVGPNRDILAFVYPGDDTYNDPAENADGRITGEGQRHRTYVHSMRNSKGGLVPVQPPTVQGLQRHSIPGLVDLQEGEVLPVPGSAKL